MLHNHNLNRRGWIPAVRMEEQKWSWFPPVNERPELSFQRRGRQPGGAETSGYNLGGFILGGLTRLTSGNVAEALLQSRVMGLYLDMNGNALSKTGQETKWLRAGSSPRLSELYW